MKPRPRPPTIITHVIVFLLLGAIVNVAVAWGLEYHACTTGVARTILVLKERVNTVGLVEHTEEYYRQHVPDPHPVTAGWPIASLGRIWLLDWPHRSPSTFDSGILVGDRLRLPVVPLWPGFAINTIFYAAMLGLLFFVPGSVRRTIRRRRGLCPACAYPTRGGTSPVCTECGTKLPLQLRDDCGDRRRGVA